MKKIKLIKNKKYSFCLCEQTKSILYFDKENRKHNKKYASIYKSVKIVHAEKVLIEVNSST